MEFLRSKQLVKKWFLLWPQTGDEFAADRVLRSPPRTPRQGSGSSISVPRGGSTSTGGLDDDGFDTAPDSPAWDEGPSSPSAEELSRHFHERSRVLRLDPKRLRPQCTEDHEVRVFAGTWNLAGLPPPPKDLSLDEWLQVDDPADIYVIGFQEIVPLNIITVLGVEDESLAAAWEDLIRSTLNEHTAPVQPSRAASYGSNTRPNSPLLPEVFLPTPPPFRLPTGAASQVEPSPLPPPVTPLELRSAEIEPAADTSAPAPEVPSPTFVPDVGPNRVMRSPEWRLGSPSTPERRAMPMWSPPRVPQRSMDATPSSSPNRGWAHIANQVQTIAGRLTGMRGVNEMRNIMDPDESDNLIPREDEEPRSPFSNPRSTDSRQQLPEGRYVRVVSKQMVGVHITVWVRTELQKHIHNIKVFEIPTGVFSVLGNKGAVSVSMNLHSTSMCFVCSHLSSGDGKGDEMKRNLDVSKILQHTRFPRVAEIDLPESILDHERCIWLGDLNYRINMGDAEVREHIANGNLEPLWECDQLRQQQELGNVFEGWHEGPVNFLPTFKYVIGHDRYVGEDPIEDPPTDTKKRIPAWCDRILWRGEKMKQLSYERSEIAFSDHRPVRSMFLVTYSILILHKLNEALLQESAERDARERDLLPLCEIHPHSLHLGEVTYGRQAAKVVELVNIGKVHAKWRAAVAADAHSPCPKWLLCEPEHGDLEPGDHVYITLEAFADTSKIHVEEVLERDGLLDGTLVVRIDGGGDAPSPMEETGVQDLYLPCSGHYLASAWGVRLERLAALKQPVRQTKFVRGGPDIAAPPPPNKENATSALEKADPIASSAAPSEAAPPVEAPSAPEEASSATSLAASPAPKDAISATPLAPEEASSAALLAPQDASSAAVASSEGATSATSLAPRDATSAASLAPQAATSMAPLATQKASSVGAPQDASSAAPLPPQNTVSAPPLVLENASSAAPAAPESASASASSAAPAAPEEASSSASSAVQPEGTESAGEAVKEAAGVPTTSLVPKEITRMVDYLLSDGVRDTPRLLEPRSLVDVFKSLPPESMLDTETEAMLWQADWADVRGMVENRIGPVREAIDTGADFPPSTTGPLVGAALLSLLHALPEPVIPLTVAGFISLDASFGVNGAMAAIEKCRMPPAHTAVLRLLLDLIHGLLQHWQSNHVTVSLTTIMLTKAMLPSEYMDEESKTRQRQFVRQLIEERLQAAA